MGAQVHKTKVCLECGSSYLPSAVPHTCQTGEIELFKCENCGTFVADGVICGCRKKLRLRWEQK